MKAFTVFLLCVALLAGACSSVKSTAGKQTDAASETANASEERDGSSYEKAVMAKSIDAEYDWLRKNCSGCKFMGQSLRKNEGKYYDVLSVQLADGTKKDFYFDINSFLEKIFKVLKPSECCVKPNSSCQSTATASYILIHAATIQSGWSVQPATFRTPR
jgi:hypothetical protein